MSKIDGKMKNVDLKLYNVDQLFNLKDLGVMETFVISSTSFC